jgi:hypothetical protein
MPATFPYSSEVEASMRALYLSLRENDRRRYAAVEADKLGHGGDDYIATLLGCDPKTIRHGRRDLRVLSSQLPAVSPDKRVRKKGADESQP